MAVNVRQSLETASSSLSVTSYTNTQDPYFQRYHALQSTYANRIGFSCIEEFIPGTTEMNRFALNLFRYDGYAHLKGFLDYDERTSQIMLNCGDTVSFYLRNEMENLESYSYSERHILVNIPIASESIEDFNALTACYYKIFWGLGGIVEHEVPLVRPLGIMQHGWSKEKTTQAAYRALHAYANNSLVGCNVPHMQKAFKRYLAQGFIFLGYEQDPEFDHFKQTCARVIYAPFTINQKQILETSKTCLTQFREKLLRSFALRNRVANGDTYGIAALYTGGVVERQNLPALLDQGQSVQSSVIQTMTDVEQLHAYADLYRQLDALIGAQEERAIFEFCGYNAEELLLSREDADTINIKVVFNLQSDNPNQFLLFGVEKANDSLPPAFVIHLSSGGVMNYALQGVNATFKRPSDAKYTGLSAADWGITYSRHQRDQVESIFQLFLEHCKVGTFAHTRHKNPLAILTSVHQRLLDAPFLKTTEQASLTNAVLGSHDSVFKLSSNALDQEICQKYHLTEGTEFTFEKSTVSVGGARGGGYRTADRTSVLRCGVDVDGNQWINISVIKRDFQRCLSDQSTTQTRDAAIQIRIKCDGTATSHYVVNEKTIELDGFLRNFGLSPINARVLSKQTHSAGSLNTSLRLDAEQIQDLQYTFRVMLSNLALLNSEHTHVEGLLHVDGRLLSDQEMAISLLIRQNPMQSDTFLSAMRYPNLLANRANQPEVTLAHYYVVSGMTLNCLSDASSMPCLDAGSDAPISLMTNGSSQPVITQSGILVLPGEGASSNNSSMYGLAHIGLGHDGSVQRVPVSRHSAYVNVASSVNPNNGRLGHAGFLLKCLCISLLISALVLLLLSYAAPAVLVNMGLAVKTVQYAATVTAVLSTVGLFVGKCCNRPNTSPEHRSDLAGYTQT